jgi:hypothetical protein
LGLIGLDTCLACASSFREFHSLSERTFEIRGSKSLSSFPFVIALSHTSVRITFADPFYLHHAEIRYKQLRDSNWKLMRGLIYHEFFAVFG